MKTLFSFILVCITSSLFSQVNYNFSTPAALSGSPWLSTATITIGGVSYTITGGINGGYTNLSSGGNGNTAALKKDGSGGDNFTIKRTDGKRFQFYNLWLKQSSYSPYPNTPPFYTIRFWNGSTNIKSYTGNTQNSTVTYAENIAVTSVSVMFNALSSYILDDLTVGPAAPSTDASLSNLYLNKGTLSPAFAAGTYSYTASAGYGTTSINVTPVAGDPLGATITVNGSAVSSGSAASVPLNLGNNTITIVVTAEDGTTISTYTIVINRSSTPDYCTPASEASWGDDVNSFTLAGEGSTSISDNNTGGGSGGYDYRTSVPSVDLMQGNSYNGTVTTNGEQWNVADGEHIKIWIDLNDNFLFESNELLYNAPSLIINGTTLNFSLAIGSAANTGPHRMRVRAIYEDPYNQTNFDGCTDEDYGETQDYNVIVKSLNPLPLTLTSIKALQIKNEIEVQWVTAGEINVDKYEVEKSQDGVTYSKAGTVAAGNSSRSLNYSWADTKPIAGYNYYRLKMIDKNGEFTFSTVVKVNFGTRTGVVKVSPNPVIGHVLGLQLQNLTAGIYEIRLLDTRGRQVFSSSIDNRTALQGKEIQLPQSINTGIYSLQVAGNSTAYSVSVFIK